MIKRVFFGWQIEPGQFVVSRVPPDLPQMPRERFASIAAAEAFAQGEKKKPVTVIWSGPALDEKKRLERQIA